MIENKPLTGYPSIDKPWLKYYSTEAIESLLPECTIYEYLWENNRDNLDNVAFDYFGKKITYRSLFENIEAAAKAFAAAGVKRGDVVIVASVTLPEVIYTMYALNRLGAIPNMVDPRTSVEGIRDYINEVEAPMAVTIDLAYPRILESAKGSAVKRIITISASDSMPIFLKSAMNLKAMRTSKKPSSTIPTIKWKSFLKTGKNFVYTPAEYQPKKCCLIVHTGGTSGSPKGVMISDDNVNAAFHQAFHSPILMARGDIFLNIMPPFIAYGIMLGIHTALCWGWKLVIIPKFDPASFDKLLIKHKPNGLIGVPSYYEKIMDSKKMKEFDLSFLKCVLAGGDKTQPDFENRINQFFHDHNSNIHLSKGYSLTEASAMATISFEHVVEIGSNGVPLPKTVIAAFEEGTDKELKYGELGEICIHSPTIMLGYYQNEAATNEMIRTHRDGLKWIHTGDLGYVTESGNIYIEGRIKRMIVRYDGFKVFPSFVERAILTHPAIEDCCVVGQQDSEHGHGQLPVAFCVLKPNKSVSQSRIIPDLKRSCQAELPDYSQPIAFYFIPKFPLTPIGKVDYRALEEMVKRNKV